MNAKLTIVVPLYNQEKYIRQCIESILNQTLFEIFVIIVNDGSNDNSLEICKELASKDNRITIISQSNQGPAAARFTGIRHTSTKYISFVDADDFLLPDAYINAVNAMDNDVDMVFFEISRYYSSGRVKQEPHIIASGKYNRRRIEEEIYPKLIWDFERKTPGIECSQCVRIVKAELLRKEYENWGENKFHYGEDAAITYPLMTKIDSLEVISHCFYMHRQRKTSEIPSYIKSNDYFKGVFALYEHLSEKLEKEKVNYDFNRQINYFYMYSVEMKKMCYKDYNYERDVRFPFNRIPYGKRVLLYGAGDVGKVYYRQIMKTAYCSDIIWVDKAADMIEDDAVKNLNVLEENVSYIDWVVIAIENECIAKEVKEFLISKGYDKNKIIYEMEK